VPGFPKWTLNQVGAAAHLPSWWALPCCQRAATLLSPVKGQLPVGKQQDSASLAFPQGSQNLGSHPYISTAASVPSNFYGHCHCHYHYYYHLTKGSLSVISVLGDKPRSQIQIG
jgi:hypothetical protein